MDGQVILPRFVWQLRIDKTAEEIAEKKLYDDIADWANAVCSVFHSSGKKGGGPHCHIYISDLKAGDNEKSVTAFEKHIRYRVSSTWGKGGNKLYYFSRFKYKTNVALNDNLVTYMSKGKLKPAYICGRTLEWYDELAGKFETKEEACVKMREQIDKASRITEFDIYSNVLTELESGGWRPTEDGDSIATAMEKIIQVRKKYKKLTNATKMNEYLYMLWNDGESLHSVHYQRAKNFLYG